MINPDIFREYDIRGIVGKDLDKSLAVSIGRAAASFIKKINPKVRCLSVGRDVRHSSADLASGIIEGIISTGIDVYDIGVCPTPLQYFSLYHLNLDGGVMVTGSHNPPEYNGFKISVGKNTIYGNDIQKLKKMIAGKEWADSDKEGKVENYNIIDAYKSYMQEEFLYLNDAKFKKIKIVVDAGNGTAGILVPDILANIGCEIFPLYCEPDGNFPNHHPDPTVVENLQDLIVTTKKMEADIGVSYDGDADRIGVINKQGDIIWGDQLMIILSREILKQNKKAKIIGDVKCSQGMFDDIKKNGGVPIMWKTGHSLIKQKMREEGALLAGEFSGHIFIGDRYYGYDDAIYTTLRLVEIMKHNRMGIQEILADIPKMCHTPEIRIDCPENEKKRVVNDLITKFVQYRGNGNSPYKMGDLNMTDGVRVVFEKGWGLFRASNTQPVIVMRVEAEDEEYLSNYRIFLEKELNQSMEAK